jgi:general secretion pathway protein E
MLKTDARAETVVDMLRQRGVVDIAAIDRARRAALAEGIRLDLALAKLGLAPEAALARAYAELLETDLLQPLDYPDEPVAGIALPISYLERARVLPLRVTDGALVVAMADPLDRGQIRAIEFKTGYGVVAEPALPSDLDAALRRLYARHQAAAPEADRTDVERLRSIASDAPVIRLVDRMLASAAECRASDIHLAPSGSGLRVRFRIDGNLQDETPPPPNLRAAIVSRLKLMAKLDIAETRLPQDGRIQVVIRGRTLDLRVSVVPTIDGESMVVRLLDGGGDRPEITRLGLSAAALDRLLELIDLPTGVTIVTGPTGSGKTTTLYAALRRLCHPDLHIATIEDPVEYRLDGVNQIQVKPEIGFDFPEALLGLLRHDPDVTMIGEIRNGQTASIGLRMALTGHPVLATLHTNDAASAVPRLLDMGVEPFLVAAVLNGVAAQRLVRSLCPECRRRIAVPEDIRRAMQARGVTPDHIYEAGEGGGCDHCRGSGYHGRTVIAEVLRITPEIRGLIRSDPDLDRIQDAARRDGMTPILVDGLAKIAAGETSLDEVVRAVGRLPG